MCVFLFVVVLFVGWSLLVYFVVCVLCLLLSAMFFVGVVCVACKIDGSVFCWCRLCVVCVCVLCWLCCLLIYAVCVVLVAVVGGVVVFFSVGCVFCWLMRFHIEKPRELVASPASVNHLFGFWGVSPLFCNGSGPQNVNSLCFSFFFQNV